MSWNKSDYLLLIGLLLLCFYLIGRSLSIGGFWWTDESRHAMDGVYILDVLNDLPFSNLYQYTEEYFVRLPALGLTWYLPFFAFIESFVFKLLGISEVNARLTVLLFALLGIITWFLFSRKVWGRSIAFLSTLIFITHPIFLFWGRSVMLEVPLITMMLFSFTSFDAYLTKPSFKGALIVGIAIFAMLLTKQTSLFLLPVLLVHAYCRRSIKTFFLVEALPAYLFTALALTVVLVHAGKFGVNAFGGDNQNYDFNALLTMDRWQMCARVIYRAYTLPVILLALLGTLGIVFDKNRNPYDITMLAWIMIWYLSITVVHGTEEEENAMRYTTYLAPVMALIATRTSLLVNRNQSGLLLTFYAMMVFTVLWNLKMGLKNEQPYVDGYQNAAKYIERMSVNTPILFCCKHDGNFIFNLRALDADRNHIVLRADKTLVSMAVHKSFGVSSNVESKEDILAILDRYGVGYVISENRDLVGLKEFKVLIKGLEGDEFKLIESFPVVTNMDEYKGVKINLYQYLDRKPIDNGEIVIPMLHLKREIKLKVYNQLRYLKKGIKLKVFD